ncbi:MAG: DinB family protein [Acidimicrobiales bacterium]
MTIPLRERPVLALNGPEAEQLASWIDFYRATLLMKCAGLGVEQLSLASVPPSTMTLLGILRHMTVVEQYWYQVLFAGHDLELFYKNGNPDGDFNNLGDTTLEDVEERYRATCELSRDLVRGHDLDEVAPVLRHGNEVDLRWIQLHMIEEYARHCGHADLLRECIDATTGY